MIVPMLNIHAIITIKSESYLLTLVNLLIRKIRTIKLSIGPNKGMVPARAATADETIMTDVVTFFFSILAAHQIRIV